MAKKINSKRNTVDVDSLLTNESIVQVDVVDEIKTGMLNYIIKTVLDRALPDVRDGLKPVQRRIIHYCNENHHDMSRAHVKNAEIAGGVMGIYHPHGSCLKHDTKFILVDGAIKTIKELYDEGVNQEVICIDNNGVARIGMAYNFRIGQYTNVIYNIELSDNSVIEVTGNHPFLLHNLTWRRADSLEVTDSLYSGIVYDFNANRPFKIGERFNGFVDHSSFGCLYVKSITSTRVNNEPMYDFTVDEYENALIINNIIDDTLSVVCVHNSYGALVTMSQPWGYRYPLIDFHGNNGNVDGDGPAADRYTEGRLSHAGMNVISGISNSCVDFKPNYSDTTVEPSVLTGLFPNLLVNGCSGMAVGYNTFAPSHNLGSVVDAIIHYINNSNCTISDLIKIIKYPDFPLGGSIINDGNIEKLYETGKAVLTVIGKHEVEINPDSGNEQIVITEIPPEVKKPKLVEKIHNLCFDKKIIPRVYDVRDESEGNGIRIVIELQKTGVPELVERALYSKTELKNKISYDIRVIVNQAPKRVNLLNLITYYVEHQRDVTNRQFTDELNKLNKRLHVQEGLTLIFKDVKRAIDIIQNSNDDNHAKSQLINVFGLSDEQCEYVLELKLRKLNKINVNEVVTLINDLKAKINNCNDVLSDPSKINSIIVERLTELKSKLNDERRTSLIESNAIQLSDGNDDLVGTSVPLTLIITNKRNIKCLTEQEYQELVNKNNYKDRSELYVKLYSVNSDAEAIFLLADGNYIKLRISDVMGGIWAPNKDNPLVDLVPINDKYDTVMVVTKLGYAKKIKVSDFKAKSGKLSIYAPLEGDDFVISALGIKQNDENVVTVGTECGIVHRFFERSFRHSSTTAKPLKCITMGNDDFIVTTFITDNDNDYKITNVYVGESNDLLTKTMNLSEFKVKGRLSQGLRTFDPKFNYKLKDLVIFKDNFKVLNDRGTLITFKELNVMGRTVKPKRLSYEIITFSQN